MLPLMKGEESIRYSCENVKEEHYFDAGHIGEDISPFIVTCSWTAGSCAAQERLSIRHLGIV